MLHQRFIQDTGFVGGWSFEGGPITAPDKDWTITAPFLIDTATRIREVIAWAGGPKADDFSCGCSSRYC